MSTEAFYNEKVNLHNYRIEQYESYYMTMQAEETLLRKADKLHSKLEKKRKN